jgi:hypothetical protein
MSRTNGRRPDAAKRQRRQIPDAEQKLVGVFRCGSCQQIFNTDPNQTVGDVETELEEDFGITMAEMVDRDIDTWILCTPCYNALAPEIRDAKLI